MFDIDEIGKYFPANNSPRIKNYKVNLSSEVVSKITYSLPPSSTAVQRQILSIPSIKEIEDVVIDSQTSTRSYAKKKTQTTPYSPYDFKQSSEIPLERKPIISYDTQLQTANLKEKPQFKDLKIVGSAAVFNRKFIGIRRTIKHPLSIVTLNDEIPIEEDPNIKEIAKTESEMPLRVFSTVKALAAIAVCQRSVYPFDLHFKKEGKDVYVIVGNNSPAEVETTLETITTTASVQRDRMTLEFLENIPETCKVNESFIQKCVEGQEKIKLGDDSDTPYLYRSIIVGGIEFVIRARIDSLSEEPKEGEPIKPLVCRVFNDIPTQLRVNEWNKLEDKRGTIFIGETNANSAKVGRWVTIANLIGASKLMIGYAVRKASTIKEPHVLLGVEQHTTEKISRDISLLQGNIYGVLTIIFSRLQTAADGKYLFTRDSKQKKTYSIYSLDASNAESAE